MTKLIILTTLILAGIAAIPRKATQKVRVKARTTHDPLNSFKGHN